MAAKSLTCTHRAAEARIAVTRVVDAPRELVFRMWTEPERLARWWGPEGLTAAVCEVEAWPGGPIRIVLRGADGVEYPTGGYVRNVVEPEGLVWVVVAENRAGEPLLDALTVVAFVDLGDRTEVAVHVRAVALAPEAAPTLEDLEADWTRRLERLAALSVRPDKAAPLRLEAA